MAEALRRCTLDCGRVESDCKFFPDLKNNSGVESSLMSLSELPDVKFFCNNNTHNKRAPSMHNKMCISKSIMEVILEHEDFKDAHRWLNEKTKTVPQTSILWRRIPDTKVFTKPSFMFVVESSHKMEEVVHEIVLLDLHNGPCYVVKKRHLPVFDEFSTQILQQFLERFIVHLAPRDSRFAFVKFSNESEVIQRFKEVLKGNNSDIERVAEAVGSPSATRDIESALDDAHYLDTDAETWLLISTGNGWINDLNYNWLKDRIYEHDDIFRMVHFFAVGQHPSWKLDRLSQITGGDSYILGNENISRTPSSFNLDMAFLASMHSSVEDRLRPVVIRYERITLKSGIIYSFQVDDGIGKDLVVTVSQNDTLGYDLSLNGAFEGHEPVSDDSSDYKMEKHKYGFGSMAISLHKDDAKPGEWEFGLHQHSSEEDVHVDVLVTAKPSGSLQCSWIWMRAWITNVTEEKKGKGTKGYHRIYAEVCITT